jgi:hypothetical protein
LAIALRDAAFGRRSGGNAVVSSVETLAAIEQLGGRAKSGDGKV